MAFGQATPPLRESRLTHLLATALGNDTALIHTLVYVPSRRNKRAEAVVAIGWAGKATAARLKKGVYALTSSKAMVSQLQTEVAALEPPSDDMSKEMREQMEPSGDAMAQLQTAVSGKRMMLSEVESDVQAQKAKVEEQLAKNKQEKRQREEQHQGVRVAIDDLKGQVEGVRSGTRLKEAVETLKKTIAEEKLALRKQLTEMQVWHGRCGSSSSAAVAPR